jgi:hypothetical protein
MDHKTAEAVRKKMEVAFSNIAGLKFTIGRGTYNAVTVSFKVEVSDDVSNRSVEEVRAENEFNQYHGLYGLKKTDLGKEFVLRGERYAVVGINSKSRKFAISIKNVKTGALLGYTQDGIKLALTHPEDENARTNDYKQQRSQEFEKNFLMFADSLGLKKTDLGREFTVDGTTYKIVGATEHKKKRNEPFGYGYMDILATSGGNSYVFTKADIAKYLNQPEKKTAA